MNKIFNNGLTADQNIVDRPEFMDPQETIPPKSNKALIIGVGLAVIVTGIVITYFLLAGEQELDGRQPPQDNTLTNAPLSPESTFESQQLPQTQGDNIYIQENPNGQNTGGPTFDVVTVDPSGSYVIAGKATPNSKVDIYVDDQRFQTVQTQNNGQFVAISDQPLGPKKHVVSLKSTREDGVTVTSDKSIIIMVSEQAKTMPLVLQTNAQTSATEVLQGGTTGAKNQMSINAIEYSASRRMTYQGTGSANSTILLYVDSEIHAEVTVDDDNQWRVSPNKILSIGLHELRLDRLDKFNKVDARLVVSFQVEDISAQVPATHRTKNNQLLSGFFTVKEGQSLWRIARAVYGTGIQYKIIYKSNENQIQNPDLIYPGQIFKLPR